MKPKLSISICLTSAVVGYTTDVAGILSLGLLLISIWLLMAGASLYGAWHVLSRFRILRTKPRRFLIIAPLMIGLIGISALAGTLLATRPAVNRQAGLTTEEELAYMFKLDQSDRYSGRFAILPGRDNARLLRTREIVKVHADSLEPESKYHAAMILQHGNGHEDYESAYRLAKAADDAGYDDANGLRMAAFDRATSKVWNTKPTQTWGNWNPDKSP
jgi:hypothetical protein